MATVRRWSGAEARALRTALRFSVRGFAAHLGIAPRTVSKWEAGGASTFPLPDTQAMLDTVLSRADEDAQQRLVRLTERRPGGDDTDTPRVRAYEDTDEVERRQLLRMLSASGAALLSSAPPWPSFIQAASGRSDDGELDLGDSLTTHFWHVYSRAQKKESILATVYDHVAALTDSLDGAHVADRQKLCRAIAEAYQLAGEIHVDQNDHTGAMHCYTLACATAREARSADLWAASLVREAYIGLFDAQPQQVVRLLDTADRIAALGDEDLVTREWVAAVRAEAHAAAGNEQECLRDLARAEAVTGKAENGTRTGWLRFDGARLPELRGSCLVSLGRYGAAEEVLLFSLDRSATTRRRSAILCDLAVIGARLRDVGSVTERLEEVLAHAAATGSAVIGRRLSTVLPELRPLKHHPRIRELDESIRRQTLRDPRGMNERELP